MSRKNAPPLTMANRFWAGLLLIAGTVLPVVAIIALWPDQMPEPKGIQIYKADFFHMRLVLDSATVVHPVTPMGFVNATGHGYLHINTILFLLVALAGFMGSMIHLASSFTNYVGSEQFKSSWILWYFVKPFTAAAVAVIVFLVLKAGLLNFDAGGGVNPFGLVIMSALAGLFTDKATLKLEEIFTTLFKPKDDRPDKMENRTFEVSAIEPAELLPGGENKILISGKGFDSAKLTVTVDEKKIGEEQKLAITDSLISFIYKADLVQNDLKDVSLTLDNGNGTPYKTTLKMQTVPVNGAPARVDEDIIG